MPKKKPTELFVVVQEGGSTGELYVHGYDDADKAQSSADQMQKDSYRTTEVIQVPDVIAKVLLKDSKLEAEFNDFLQETLCDVVRAF